MFHDFHDFVLFYLYFHNVLAKRGSVFDKIPSLPIRGFKGSTRDLDKLYDIDSVKSMIGRRGVPSLWTFGINHYNLSHIRGGVEVVLLGLGYFLFIFQFGKDRY